jgi:type I restriction enzyme, S subunit
VWEGQIPCCLHQNHIFAVRTNTAGLYPKFLALQLSSHYAKEYFTLTSKKTTNLASTNQTKIGAFQVLLPQRNEQQKIVAFLEKQTSELATAASSAEYQISKMEEYRTALISAAVTGKIDVRNM